LVEKAVVLIFIPTATSPVVHPLLTAKPTLSVNVMRAYAMLPSCSAWV
jgi:hypothetical protein